jgi:radical SAM protein with 4Fe4S-binding SPASM domain
MSFQTFSTLGDIFPLIQTVVLGSARGEPLLHPHFFEMLKFLKSKGIEVHTISNTTLINSEIAERLVKEGLDLLVISMEAASRNLYNQIRQGADLDTVIKNIQGLNRAKNRYPYLNRVLLKLVHLSSLDRISKELSKQLLHLKIDSLVNRLARLPMQLAMLFLPIRFAKKLTKPVLAINFVCMKDNIHELPDLVRLAGYLGVDFIILSPLGEVNGWSKGRSLDQANTQIDTYFHLAQRLGVKHNVKLITQQESCSLKHYDIAGASVISTTSKGLIKSCSDPWTSTYIRIQGDVYVCCRRFVIMGNIHQQDLRDIWNSPAYNEFRQRLASPEPPEECRRCPARAWIEI